MEENKEDKLKRLIQSVELDQPGVDFTAKLMKQLEHQEAIVVNVALQSLLTQNLVESPTIDFTEKVMLGIERIDKKAVYAPVISKKVWYGVGIAATISLVLIGFFSKSSESVIRPSPLANNINHLTIQIIEQIKTLPTVYLACLFAITLLLLLDYGISFRKKYST